MSVAVEAEAQVLHELTGRMRVHVPAWVGGNSRRIEQELLGQSGVRRAEVNALTGNVLILFDPKVTNTEAILARIRRLTPPPVDDPGRTPEERPRPAVLRAPHGRARIAVPGIDRDPHLARAVVDRLQKHPGVKAHASPLTGRVLVEYDEHRTDLDDLVAEITGMDLPDIPEGDRPAHPLDPAPLIQSAARTAGAATGLALLAVRRLAGSQGPPISDSTPAVIASIIGIVQGFPGTRNGLRSLLGRNAADILVQGAAIVSLALSGSPLGLALTGGESLRLLTEVVARQAAWRRYEERLHGAASAQPGAVIRLEAGERVPLKAHVVEGTGTAVGRDGLPKRVAPGETIAAGARLGGGPFVLDLEGGEAFAPEPRPAPPAPNLDDRYGKALGPISLAYAALTAVVTRSPSRTFSALLLVTPRTAVIGSEMADIGTSARVLRAGVTVVDTRPDRQISLPGLLLLDSSRVLTDGYEVRGALPMTGTMESAEILARAAGIAAAAGSPWGGAFPVAGAIAAQNGSFDGETASATVAGVRYTLGPNAGTDAAPQADDLRERGNHPLALRSEKDGLLGLINLRPRLAPDVAELVESCQRHGVELALFNGVDSASTRMVARRAKIALLQGTDSVAAIRSRQVDGTYVAFVADSADAAAAFAACDLAIGLSSGHGSRFPARADLLAPDLSGLAAIVEATARRQSAARDAVALSAVANVAGAVWGFRGAPGLTRASQVVYITALAALVDGWFRLKGGRRRGAAVARLVDPRPERWGRYSVDEVLRTLGTSARGLESDTAHARRQDEPASHGRNAVIHAVLDQVRSPLAAVLGASAGLALVVGAPLDFAIIGATLGVNVAVGAWQERRAGQAAETLARLGAATARVIRAGEIISVSAAEVVPGDVLVLRTGDRVAADARVLEADNLEVDEAALTGESLPVPKAPEGGTDASRVLLEGSDVTVGTGRAIVFAVGRATRMGATAAALASDDTEGGALGMRLSRMMRQLLPLAAAGGAIVVASGVLRGRALPSQLAIGASIAIASVPEGLPLLTGVGQAAVARRLADSKALVRRLNAVEALGRVDIACTDKTGTLTEGRLALTLVADLDRDQVLPEPSEPLPADLREVLRTAALASPRPDGDDGMAHSTDMAIVRGAQDVGLGDDLLAPRTAEAPFDSVRSFHSAVAGGQLFAKGAAETLAPRCDRVWRGGAEQPLDDVGRAALRSRAEELAARGLRVLMVARGGEDTPVTDPRGMVALGFVGISDPLRADVPAAVRRCQAAGIRVIMLTGDHPATARAIAREAGLLHDDASVLTGVEIADLHNGDLDQRLAGASVIARVTPLDKLRIVESLQRQGHAVAMTGDGVNDAPALRLADVGVAMGHGGTEVARQAADVILADDDFATLVEALVEGRSFWRNIRRALGLLLGGNLGELGLVVGASVLGLASPLVTRQILAVNLITDALPALAVALQRPAHHNLAALAREGAVSLDKPLRDDVLRRGALTAAPSLAAYLIALGTGGLPRARSVAFASVVATQLAQTLEAGKSEDGLTMPVLAAVAGSSALLIAALTVPPLRQLLMLALPTPLGWSLIGAATLAALVACRLPAGTLVPMARSVVSPRFAGA